MDTINFYLALATQLIEQQHFELALHSLALAREAATSEGTVRSTVIAVRITQVMNAIHARLAYDR